jgi:hypothetical protein
VRNAVVPAVVLSMVAVVLASAAAAQRIPFTVK